MTGPPGKRGVKESEPGNAGLTEGMYAESEPGRAGLMEDMDAHEPLAGSGLICSPTHCNVK